MNLPEYIPQTEENIPLLAHLAVEQAYQRAVESGVTMVTSENGMLVERTPQGNVREIHPLPIIEVHEQDRTRFIQ